MGDDLQMGDALGAGSAVYRAAVAVLQEIATALSMPGVERMWQTMQAGCVIRRAKFMEAVMLRYCMEITFSKRTDARNAVIKSSSELLQRDYDWLVMDIHSTSAPRPSAAAAART